MNRAEKILGMDDRKMMLIGIIVSSMLIPIFFFNSSPLENLRAYLVEGILVTSIFSSILWVVNRTIVFSILENYPFPEKTSQNVFLQVTLIVIVTFILANIIAYIEHQLRSDGVYLEYVEREVGISAILSAFVCAVYNSIHIFHLYKKTLVEKERLQKENIQSQLEILKNQVKPHFLFNSLNTLASIIPDEPEMAVDYVQKLSKVYRYILEIKDKKLIPVEEELACIKAYLFMLKIRFGENLQVNIQEDNLDLDSHVVPLSLQLLIENAVKHNVISSKRPLHIAIFQENNRLKVRNNLQKKDQQMLSTGTGLNNIRSRYEILSKQDIEVLENKEYFVVSLPLIEVLS